MKFVFAFILLLALTDAVTGSPYRDKVVAVKIEGYEWGFWRVVDVPLDPDPEKQDWYLTGPDTKFITYWCFGASPYLMFQISQGLGFSAIAVTIAVSGVVAYLKKKKIEQSAPPNGGPTTPDDKSDASGGGRHR